MTAARVLAACVVGACIAAARLPLTAQNQPDDDAAAQLFTAAEAARAEARFDDAIAAYHRIVADHPASTWAARALIESATCLVVTGAWSDAMRQLQTARQKSGSAELADIALERNTILYRLHLRPGQPAYQFAPNASANASAIDLRRVGNIAVDGRDLVHVATRKALYVYNEFGSIARTVPGDDYRSVILRDGAVLLVGESSVRLDGEVVPLVGQEAGRTRDVDVEAATLAPGGDLLVADRKSRSILRFGADGAFRVRVAAGDVVRLAASPLGDVAAVTRETGAVFIVGRDGAPHAFTGTAGGAPMRAVDVAYDVFAHLYVLERDSVSVFAPTGERIVAFAPGGTGRTVIGGFHTAVAFAVDESGRLFVLDAESERVQVYH